MYNYFRKLQTKYSFILVLQLVTPFRIDNAPKNYIVKSKRFDLQNKK